MDLQLKNKRALVAGSSRGLGYAIARTLAFEGCRVAINGRNPQSINEAARQGFTKCIVPSASLEGMSKPKKIEIIPVDNLRDALRAGLGQKQRAAQSDPTD